MPNIRLTIAYEGTKYAGWQVQKNAKTIQGEIEKALRKVLGENVRLVGSGRTDSGVHAKAQIANFKTGKEFPLTNLQNALNANLPDEISITKIKKTYPKFHSQYAAKGKIYRYTILGGRAHDLFLRRLYWRVPYALDLKSVRKEAKTFVGKHDFKSFQRKSAHSPIKNTVRTITRLAVKKKGAFVQIEIEADGFLHNMARNIVGTLVEIGRGYLPEGSAKAILRARDRRKAGPTAPAKGLILLKVKY
ncbi:MAG: tRNA pseudouridine(38-40) synthase TruA [Omnitrophica bacterium]|nr:tRNA pseudouridine(38-40) synthase TruA [Candidatus Omnitrophota bacterium]